MAANLDVPKRRSLRLSGGRDKSPDYGSPAVRAPARPSPATRAPARPSPATRLSGGNMNPGLGGDGSFNGSKTRSHRRVTDRSTVQEGEDPDNGGRAGRNDGEGAPSVRGEPGHHIEASTQGCQEPVAPGRESNFAKRKATAQRRSHERSRTHGRPGHLQPNSSSDSAGLVIGETAQAKVSKGGHHDGDGASTLAKGRDHEEDGPSGENEEAGSSLLVKGRGHEEAGSSLLVKGRGHEEAGSSMLVKGRGHEEAGSSMLVKGRGHEEAGSSMLVKGRGHEEAGSSRLTKGRGHEEAGPSRLTKGRGHEEAGSSMLVKGRGHEEAGSSMLVKGRGHEEAGSSMLVKERGHEEAGSSMLVKERGHEEAGSSRLTKAKDHEEAGPSRLTKGKDHEEAGPSTLTKERGHKEAGPSTLTKERGHKEAGPSMLTKERGHEEAGSSRLTKEKDHKEAGPSTLTKGNDCDLTGCSNVSRGSDPETAGPSIVSGDRERQKVGPSIGAKGRDLEEAEPSSVCQAKVSEKAGPFSLKSIRDIASLIKNKPPHAALPAAGIPSGSSLRRDHKVHCCSKQLLQEVLGLCAEVSKEVLENQQHLSQERRQLEHRNCVWDFETAFQENVCINGQSWHEAPYAESEPDIKMLEDQFDDVLVETALKRKRYPQKILSQFVRGLKVEREILDEDKPIVNPEEIKLDSAYESRMMDLATSTTTISQQISELMKALPAQLEKAEGFSQVLNLQPILEGSRIRQDIFSSHVVLEDIAKALPKSLETTPRENESQTKTLSVLNLKRRQSHSTQMPLYPLRSKRKISLPSQVVL